MSDAVAAWITVAFVTMALVVGFISGTEIVSHGHCLDDQAYVLARDASPDRGKQYVCVPLEELMGQK